MSKTKIIDIRVIIKTIKIFKIFKRILVDPNFLSFLIIGRFFSALLETTFSLIIISFSELSS